MDTEIIKSRNEAIIYAIEWWEIKRILYNKILIGFQLAIMLFAYDEIIFEFGLFFALYLAFLHTLVANLLYSLGEAIEVWISYYFNKGEVVGIKPFMFVIGVIFSLLLTTFMYDISLMSLSFRL